MNTHPTSAPPLRLGFVGLTDCAPLAVAQHLGLFEQQGLTVEFSREPSWANMRDKLALGLFDGAHLLAPMLLAANLNLEKLAQPLCASLCLGLGGNAIVLTASLIAEAQITPDQIRNPLQSSVQLGQWHRSEASRARKLRFAAVHPYSTHYYELCAWLAAGGIDRAVDMRLIAKRSYRPELYRHAARALGLSVPTVDYLPEGLHQSPRALAAATSGPTAMGADWFFDGSTFDPLDPAGYLECITAHNPGMSHLIPSPLHLRLLNPIFQLHSTALELHP
ncbi:MAG: ABC transporter substrate-binding protein [Halothiobacillus sp.]